MNSMKLWCHAALLSGLALAAPMVMGCAFGAGDDTEPSAAGADLGEETAEAQQALTCVDAACNGVNPYATTCVIDQVLKQSSSFNGPSGPLGSISLYYSPTCHAAWGYTALTGTHGMFSTCVQNAATESGGGCYTGGSQTFSQISPMMFLPVGQSAHARTDVQAGFDVYGGLTSPFTRTF
jgi:hypothetical protein